jgi:hypothetical protein
MRLDTAEKRAQYRAAMIPDGATPDARNNEHGAIYLYERGGKLCAMAFWGKAGKAQWSYYFRTQEQRAAKVDEFFNSVAAHQDFRAKMKAPASAGHDVKIGDVFRCSWGYDQTNIDYYQCVALIGACMMEVREIEAQTEETGWLQGKCVPAIGKFSTEPDGSEAGQKFRDENGYYPSVPKKSRRVKISLSSSGEPSFCVASYASAYRMKPAAVIAGKPIFNESHWTAYA